MRDMHCPRPDVSHRAAVDEPFGRGPGSPVSDGDLGTGSVRSSGARMVDFMELCAVIWSSRIVLTSRLRDELGYPDCICLRLAEQARRSGSAFLVVLESVVQQ